MTTNLPTNASEERLVGSIDQWVRNAAVGPLPGWATIIIVVAFYGWILYASVRTPQSEGELAFGDVHV